MTTINEALVGIANDPKLSGLFNDDKSRVYGLDPTDPNSFANLLQKSLQHLYDAFEPYVENVQYNKYGRKTSGENMEYLAEYDTEGFKRAVKNLAKQKKYQIAASFKEHDKHLGEYVRKKLIPQLEYLQELMTVSRVMQMMPRDSSLEKSLYKSLERTTDSVQISLSSYIENLFKEMEARNLVKKQSESEPVYKILKDPYRGLRVPLHFTGGNAYKKKKKKKRGGEDHDDEKKK